MTSAQIEVFFAIVKYKSFSAASRELYITQPAISRHITRLEQELGSLLFDRTQNPIRLTEAGKQYYDLFSRFYTEYEGLRNKLKKTILQIGVPTNWDISRICYSMIDQLAKNEPGVEISFNYLDYDLLLSNLRQGSLDFIITADFAAGTDPEFRRKELAEVQAILYYSKRHPLADRPDLKIEDFKNEPFLINEQTLKYPVMKERLSEICPEFRFKEVANEESVIRNVQYGLGISTCDTMMKGLEEFEYIPTGKNTQVMLVWMKTNSSEILSRIIADSELLFRFREEASPG